MLSHANLMHNQAVIWRHFAHSSSSIVAGWLPMFHDMGLIGTVMQPLYMGRPCILMDPVRFIERPVRWLRAITKYAATTSGAPNFAYDMCVDRIPAAEREGLDLRSWDLAFNGAEPIRAATLERFAAAFGSHGFRAEAAYPCYGLAEAALMVSGGPKSSGGIVRHVHAADLEQHRVREVEPGAPEGRALVSCGLPAADQRVVAVDPEAGRPLPEREVGEIWVSGPSVALGYWRRSEESRETFEARTPEGGRYLRTGDLGFLRDGMVWVTGRLKDLLIIHGKNHYPHDLEHTAESSHPALRPTGSAAFLVEGERQERLALVLEVAAAHVLSLDASSVAGAVRAAVSREHGVHAAVVALVRSGAVPKTSSGKVRRRACREALERGELPLLALDAIGWNAEAPAGSPEVDGGDPAR
jgi:acyl-CoA synthetase (AMP-forming)/AMP-acid ligase II